MGKDSHQNNLKSSKDFVYFGEAPTYFDYH
jgi:hypothetical protein